MGSRMRARFRIIMLSNNYDDIVPAGVAKVLSFTRNLAARNLLQ